MLNPRDTAAKGDDTLEAPAVDLSALPPEIINKNELLRMQQDLQRALKKPRGARKWAMVLDLRKCVGCSACTIACKAENVLPPGGGLSSGDG